MFDLVAGTRLTEPRRPGMPVVVTTTTHLMVIGAFIVVPLLSVTEQLPEVPTMLAFVAAAPSPPPPPPPPAPVQPRQTPAPPPAAADRMAAPIEAPVEIAPEIGGEGEVDEGAFEGVEGGVPGGVVGGIVGGLADAPPPPPPPPPPPALKKIVRLGGQLHAPDLIKRVEPEYPAFAVSAGAQGVVILEATVDEDGEVIDVKVLRSVPLLDRAAIAAVRQWRYSPLLLNGIPTRFALTVSLSFHLETRK